MDGLVAKQRILDRLLRRVASSGVRQGANRRKGYRLMEIIAWAIGLSGKGVRLRSVNSAWFDVCKALFYIEEDALSI